MGRRGLTLVEVLIVAAVAAVLAGLLLATTQRVREAANRAKCANNLKQFGLALHHYHDAHDFLPPTHLTGTGNATWCLLVLPYLDQDNLYRWLGDPGDVYYVRPADAIETQVVVFHCPT